MVSNSTLAIQASETIDLAAGAGLVTESGLSDDSLIYSVNGIEGGNEEIGTVSTAGNYSPPLHSLETISAEISITPVAAPSFGETIQITVNPTEIDFDWILLCDPVLLAQEKAWSLS